MLLSVKTLVIILMLVP